jgi:uncharacterized protein
VKTSSNKQVNEEANKTHHVPERTCIACRTTGNKRALIRIVRTEKGVEIDLTSKKSGRGAYLCPLHECWEACIKGNKLEHALRVKLEASERKTLEEYGKTLPGK